MKVEQFPYVFQLQVQSQKSVGYLHNHSCSHEYELFVNFVANTDFEYKTNTEKLLESLIIEAEKDKIEVNKEVNQLKNTIAITKNNALRSNQIELKELITDQLVKRYFYKEGLYVYHLSHNKSIQKAIEILNTNQYQQILN